jgi:hypothetical protein
MMILLLLVLAPWLRREHQRRVRAARVSAYITGYYRGSAAAVELLGRWHDTNDPEDGCLFDGCLPAGYVNAQRRAGLDRTQ